MGDDDRREVVFLFKADQFHHKAASSGAFLGVVANERYVVYHEETGALDGSLLYRCEYFFFKVRAYYEFGVDLSSGEIVREYMAVARGRVGIAHLELLAGEFEVKVQDFLLSGNFFGYLGGKDGFANVA